MPTKQVITTRVSSGGFGSNGTFRSLWQPTDLIATPESRIAIFAPVNGTIKNLIITTTVAPTAGNTGGLLLRVAGADTALTAVVQSSATVAYDIAHSISVTAGQRINWVEVSTGTGLAGTITVSWEFVSAAGKISIYGGGDASTVVSTSTAVYCPVFGTFRTWETTAAVSLSICPIPGNITGISLGSSAAPGVGKSYTAFIYKSTDGGATFVKQDGTGGTVNTQTQISGNSATNAIGSFTLPASPGDMFYCEISPAGTPTSARLGIVFAFTADRANEFIIGGTSAAFSASAARFAYPVAYNSFTISATEANANAMGGISAMRLDNLYCQVASAPGAAKSINIRGRKQAGNAGPSVTISGTTTPAIGNDTSTVAALISSTDTYDIGFTPSGTPTASVPVWAMRARTTSAPSNKGRGGAGQGAGGGGLSLIGSPQVVFLNPFTIFGS